MKKKLKKIVSHNLKEQIHERVLSEQELFESLILGPQSKANQELSDKSLDQKAQEIELISGVVISPIDYLLNAPKAYRKTIPLAFYLNIFRLNGWDIEGAKKFRKPRIVAIFTNELLYGRFHNEALPLIESKNPFISKGNRQFKHFQFLSDGAEVLLEKFIFQAIQLMEASTTWYEFRQKMFDEFKVPYQLRLL